MRHFRTGVFLAAVMWTTAAGAGVDTERLKNADRFIEEAIAGAQCPGAVLLVGRGDEVVYRKAYGNKSVQPEKTPMTVDTIFDMASLSKPLGCASSVMILADRGKINVHDPVAKYLPAFAQNGKDKVTIEMLLLHRGGLTADNNIDDYKDGPAKAWENIFALPLKHKPGTFFQYSDVGFEVLGKLVETVDGRTLDRFAHDEVFGPLGMKDTTYNPPPDWRPRIAPTQQREGHWMIGEVHDPRAYALGGVAGHAGVFSTADDVARYCRMIIHDGELEGRRILSEATVKEMEKERCLPDGTGCRGYGFDIDTGYSQPRGERFERGKTFGHTGFTGTCFWIDPGNQCYFILLTNSVHPDGNGKVLTLRRLVSTAVAEALLGPRPEMHEAALGRPADVLCGIDVLERDNFKQLEGRKVALITNHTGRDKSGKRTVEVLAAAKNVKLVKLFSPEHGLYGVLDEKVGNTTDKETGLPVFSLYGETRRPTAEMLEGVDTLVFDIQDIGTRFYTYPTTMALCMEAAKQHGIRMVVLDRPNPITGVRVDGPVADKKHFGFTAYGATPLVHGLTVGELARLYNEEFGIGCQLTIIQLEGWRRSMWWDETGLMWTNPSPNMRNLTQAVLYPAVGLLEASNVSVGRGTDQPFELFGAPWVDAKKLAAALNGARLPGLRFVPIEFTPRESKFKGQECQGVYIILTDRSAVEPARSGITFAWMLRKLFGDDYKIDLLGRMIQSDPALVAVKEAVDPAAVSAAWDGDLEKFNQVRKKYLLYP